MSSDSWAGTVPRGSRPGCRKAAGQGRAGARTELRWQTWWSFSACAAPEGRGPECAGRRGAGGRGAGIGWPPHLAPQVQLTVTWLVTSGQSRRNPNFKERFRKTKIQFFPPTPHPTCHVCPQAQGLQGKTPLREVPSSQCEARK